MRNSDFDHRPVFTRRGLLIGAGASLVCKPSIVRASNLMPVRSIPVPVGRQYYGFVARLYVASHLPRILKLRAAGLSARSVAAALNSWNIQSMNGKDWDAEGVTSVLSLDQNIRRADEMHGRDRSSTRIA
jgi:hypothetical protein